MDSKYYEQIGKAVEYAKTHNGDLTTQNLLYVVKVAKKIAMETGANEDDLISVGAEAMKKQELKYDKTKNDNFVKSCWVAVRGEMMNFVNRQTNLVHIPVNHLCGFKKGQEAREETKISYHFIEEEDYESLGECSNTAFSNERETILRDGISHLDYFGKIAIKMKLRLDEYKDIKKNNIKDIAEEMEVPVQAAKKIYDDAFKQLSRYCQNAIK